MVLSEQEPLESTRLSESAGRYGGHRARRNERPRVPARVPPAIAGERQGHGRGGGASAAVAAVHLPERAETPPHPLPRHRRAERLDRLRALPEDSTTPVMMDRLDWLFWAPPADLDVVAGLSPVCVCTVSKILFSGARFCHITILHVLGINLFELHLSTFLDQGSCARRRDARWHVHECGPVSNRCTWTWCTINRTAKAWPAVYCKAFGPTKSFHVTGFPCWKRKGDQYVLASERGFRCFAISGQKKKDGKRNSHVFCVATPPVVLARAMMGRRVGGART